MHKNKCKTQYFVCSQIKYDYLKNKVKISFQFYLFII
eukprot:UN02410